MRMMAMTIMTMERQRKMLKANFCRFLILAFLRMRMGMLMTFFFGFYF